MGQFWYKHNVLCHWCGKLFESKKGRLQTRFCSTAHKQAHYRAYKKYVTAKGRHSGGVQDPKVTLVRAKRPTVARQKKKNRNCRDCSRLDWADTEYRADHNHKTYCKLPNKKPRVLDKESPCKDFRPSANRKKRKK